MVILVGMSKSSKVLVVIIVLSTCLAVAGTYYQTMVLGDFDVYEEEVEPVSLL